MNSVHRFAYRRRILLYPAFVAVLVISSTSFAQVVGGTISGTVRDASGSQLAHARVTIRNLESGTQRGLQTDDEGRYAAPSVPVGRYSVSASADGFATQTTTNIQLQVAQSVHIDLQLAVGEVRQEVSVSDVPAAVNTGTNDISGLVNEKQVKELPLNGRSYDALITLNPGIVNYTQERSGNIGTSNSSVGNMFSVTGHRPQDNLFLLNGVEYTGASEINVTPGGTSGQLLGVDAVREFNVVTDTYGAAYGKRPGAQVSIVTAAGTNQLHGSAYEFLRNSALDARNFFDQDSIPAFQRNEFGGSLGGPIVKDKLQLFGNYEGYRQNLGLSDVTLVPDNDARSQASPSVQPLLALWPVQNGPELGNGIAEAFSHPLQRIREDFGTTRVDTNLSPADSAFFVYTVDDSDANTPSVNPLSGVVESLREQVLSGQEQHVVSSRLLNTARVGFSRAAYFFTGTTPVDLPGWVSGKPIGAVVIGGGTALNGASQISVGGTNAGSNLTTVRNLFTFDDHVYYTHGIHQIEAGAWLQRIQSNDNLAQYQYGQASFGSLAAFLAGNVSTFTVVPSPTALGWRSFEGASFVEDTVKVRPQLEVRVGFRFESTNGWNEAQSRASNYLFDGSGALITQPRIGASAFTVNRAKFLPEPRVGIAWDPTGHGGTVVHAGFGIYRSLLDTLDYRLDQTAPFNATQSIKNVPLSSLQIAPGTPLPSGSKVSPSGIQPDAQTPTVISYTLSVEQQVAPSTSVKVGYVGSHGYHQMLSEDVNEPVPTICPAAPCPSGLPTGTVYYPKGAPLANPNLANSTTWISSGVSSYNALEVDANHRFNRGFQLRGVYTFSKSLDDGTAWNSSVGANAPGFVEFPGNASLDYGRSNTDVRHLAVIHGTYELPFGPGHALLANTAGWRLRALTGWTVSEIATLQSGLPFTPQLGFNPSNNGDSRNPVRPSINPAFRGNIVRGGPRQYFNPNAFLVPAAGTYGNLGRNTLTGPGLAGLDFSVTKNTSLTERVNLQFRSEFFNVFNRTNFGTPNAVVYTSAPASGAGCDNTIAACAATPSPTAGVITTTATNSRQVQFGLKVLF